MHSHSGKAQQGMEAIQVTASSPIYDSPILIVDDSEVNRKMIEQALRTRGFNRLLSAPNGEAALVELERFRPELVILDVMMPVMDGLECCARIRQMPEHRDLPILIQTTLTDRELRVKAFEEGATDFISKPIYPKELYARVMVHLEKRLLVKNLQGYKARIEQELESARQLQSAILPQAEEIAGMAQQHGLDIASHFQPSSEVGGDFWGMKNLSPQRIALWMVDFSGHGVASALNAFRLQAYLKEYSPQANDPGDYLSHLNDKLLHLLLRGQFATMFYGIVDTAHHTLTYACASSPHPIVLRQSGKAEMIDGSGVPLGIAAQAYATQTIDFHSGDTLLLYSDALIETPNDADGYITEAQMMRLLGSCIGKPSAKIMEALLNRFRKHSSEALADDLTVVLCTRG